MGQPSGAAVPSGDTRAFNLTKLCIMFVLILFAYRVFSELAGYYFLEAGAQSRTVPGGLKHVYIATALFVLLEMFVVLWFYRPVVSLLTDGSAQHGVKHMLLYDVLLGVGTGLLVFLVAMPLLRAGRPRLFVYAIFPAIHPIQSWSVLWFLLFGAVLPIVTEMVFRGVVLRTLQIYVSPLAAILVSATLFASLWPVFSNSLIAVVLGTMTGVLYQRRHSLIPAIVANCVMSASGMAFVVWQIWR